MISRNSLKLNVDVNGHNSSSGVLEESIKREIYKPIPEDNHHLHQQNGKSLEISTVPSATTTTTTTTSNKSEQKESSDSGDQSKSLSAENGDTNKMVQGEGPVNDGADEQMLGVEEEKLAEKREEVKFIKGDHQNGDAKIDIGSLSPKTFTGMTKEELMKYANDPFWVRLRWIFFILFWAIWVAMLVGAILIIVDAPKCAAPEPLPWFKRGLLAKFKSFGADVDDVAASQKIQATGAIYELPAELTYSVSEPDVEKRIKDIVSVYKDSDVNVILDLTPNYVSKDSRLVKDALADETKRSAFIWIEKPEVPNNWLSIQNGSAWAEVRQGNYVLSQFGDGLYDLNMNDTIVKREFGDVLTHLVSLGVKGFRLKNTKYFILSRNIRDEVPSNDPKYIHTQYGFWTHTQTTFQEGLGDVLNEYKLVAKGADSDVFLTVTEDVIRPEVYQTSAGGLGIDMPIYGRFLSFLSSPKAHARQLHGEILTTLRTVGNNTWLQWDWGDVKKNPDGTTVNPSALGLFTSLLPGVPVVPVASPAFADLSADTYKQIKQLRSSSSYMHGDFKIYDSDDLLAYSRIKSGNPGYFVAFNPWDVTKTCNFTSLELPDKMSVNAISENFSVANITVRSKVSTNALEVSPYATIVLTYVPVKPK